MLIKAHITVGLSDLAAEEKQNGMMAGEKMEKGEIY